MHIVPPPLRLRGIRSGDTPPRAMACPGNLDHEGTMPSWSETGPRMMSSGFRNFPSSGGETYHVHLAMDLDIRLRRAPAPAARRAPCRFAPGGFDGNVRTIAARIA